MSTLTRAARASVIGAVAVASYGCAQDALDEDCPAVGAGELVVSELRGPQDQDEGDDSDQWIELYAATATDLAGLRIELRKIDGSETVVLYVRSSTPVAAGDYAVLGRYPDSALPAHVDYGFGSDLPGDLYAAAGVELFACGAEVDRMIYRDLTDFGTLALDGAEAPPDAEGNDDETAFCVDEHLDDADPFAARGSPGAANPPCP